MLTTITRKYKVHTTHSWHVGVRVHIHNEYTYMRVHEKYACGTDTQLPASVLENSGLATSVGSVFGKPGPHTRPLCYVYCLHRARNGQNLVEVSHAH